jgi:alpha-L-fucosidase 2
MHSNGHDGVAFQVRVKVHLDGGHIVALDRSLQITDATAATILVATATSFMGGDPEIKCDRIMVETAKRSYEELKGAQGGPCIQVSRWVAGKGDR